MHYQHNLDQIHTFTFREGMIHAPNPARANGIAHKVLPVHTCQASQHHWDEAKPSTHQWKPVSVQVHKLVAGSTAAVTRTAFSSLALALPLAGSTMRSPPACMLEHSSPILVSGNSKLGEKPLVKLC